MWAAVGTGPPTSRWVVLPSASLAPLQASIQAKETYLMVVLRVALKPPIRPYRPSQHYLALFDRKDPFATSESSQ